MSEDKRERNVKDWLAPDFTLLAEPDEMDQWTIVFADKDRDMVAAASPSGLMSLALDNPIMFKSDRHQGDHWLHNACPIRYGLINGAVKCRTDLAAGPDPEAGERRIATPPVTRAEALQTVVPVIEMMALRGEIEGVAHIEGLQRKLRELENHALTSVNFVPSERVYHALGQLRFARDQVEQHPRYAAYKAAFEYARALVLDKQATWDEVVQLAGDLV